MASQLAKKLVASKKSPLINKKVKLKKITIIKKAKATIIKKEKPLQKRKKKILLNKKAKFKKITLLKKRKKAQLLLDNKALLKKREAQRKKRQRKWRKKKERSRREVSHLQLVSGDTVTIPVEQAIETVEKVETVESVKEVETQPIEYVSGELYNSIFALGIESPIQVDSQLWDTIKENLPDNYMIPDPEFLEAVAVEDLPIGITSEIVPALLQPIDASSETSLSELEQESQLQSTKAEMVWNKPRLIDDPTESE